MAWYNIKYQKIYKNEKEDKNDGLGCEIPDDVLSEFFNKNYLKIGER